MAATASSPTFNKDVLPIMQKNCQSCHGPGEVAPMSLMTNTDARPWAKSIKAAVVGKKMPPWYADDGYAHIKNDKRLSTADVTTIAAWVDAGAPEGDAKDRPAPVTFTNGWNIMPDMIVERPQDFHVPARGAIKYQNILVKVNFPEDKWVVAAEVRPGNASVVHHVRLDVREPGSQWMEKAIPGVAYATNDELSGRRGPEGENLLGKYNPGLGAQDVSMGGVSAKFPRRHRSRDRGTDSLPARSRSAHRPVSGAGPEPGAEGHCGVRRSSRFGQSAFESGNRHETPGRTSCAPQRRDRTDGRDCKSGITGKWSRRIGNASFSAS
jgi:hypothetical protein